MLSQKNIKQRALVIGLIILGIIFTAFFGMRAFHAFRKFNGHRPPPRGKVETDIELVRDWMTISFISERYRVSEKDIFDALKITPLGNHNKSLLELNHKYYPSTDGFVLKTVKATLLEHQKLPPEPGAPNAPTALPPPTVPATATP